MTQYLPEFLALFAANFLNIISPGPETALMIHNSSRHSKQIGIFTGLGIVCSTLIHKTYTLLGFGLFISKTPLLFDIIKYTGSLYLFYLGYRALRPHSVEKNAFQKPKHLTPKGAFRMGFFMDILHPGASFFFVSIVAATVSPETPLSVQAMYGILLILTSLCWYSFLACAFSNRHVQSYAQNAGKWLDRLMGYALIGLGIRLALFTIK